MRQGKAKILLIMRAACLGAILTAAGILPGFGLANGSVGGPALAGGPVDGPHPFLTVLCKFADVPNEPFAPAYFERLLGAEYPGLDDYWREVSYGRMSLAGSKVTGWVTLSQGKAAYFDAEGKPDFLKLAQDCGRSGGLKREPDKYFGLNLVFNEGRGVTYGGRYCLDALALTSCYGVTWLWPPYLENQAIWAHEMGHALGLGHTGRGAGRTYGNIWDVMSVDGGCHSDPELGLLAQHMIAAQKDLLGWIPTTARLVLPTSGEMSFKLTPLARSLGPPGEYLLAEIPIDGSESHFYTLEARTRLGYDGGLLRDAVLIHEVEWGTGPARRVDPSITLRWEGSADDPAGSAFSDPANGIRAQVVEEAEDGFYVIVRIDPPDRHAGDALPEPANRVSVVRDVRPVLDTQSTGAAPDATYGPESVFALGRGGRQHAVYLGTPDASAASLRYATRLAGEEWGSDAVIVTTPDPDGLAAPTLATGRDGTVYAAWSQKQDGVWQVHIASRGEDAVRWTRPEVVSSLTGGDARAPVVAVDGSGRVYVLWRAMHSCGAQRLATDILLRVRGEDGTWQAIERVDASPTLGTISQLRLVVEAPDKVYVGWMELGHEGEGAYLGFRSRAGQSPGNWQVAKDVGGAVEPAAS